MWSCLADVLLVRYCRILINRREVDFSSVQNLPQPDQLSALFCAEKLLKIQEQGRIPLRSSYCSRIGKIFLRLATNEIDKLKREELLKKALVGASKYKSVQASSYEHAPRICAQVILHQWAMSFCAERRDVAEECYRKMYNYPTGELII